MAVAAKLPTLHLNIMVIFRIKQILLILKSISFQVMNPLTIAATKVYSQMVSKMLCHLRAQDVAALIVFKHKWQHNESNSDCH